MQVRDAIESDAEAIASLSGQPTDAARDTIHDRSVRVAVCESGEGSGSGETLGFVAFDARRDTVHVTGFGGGSDAVERLLESPIRFAETEGMPVEALVESEDELGRSQLTDAGFAKVGTGPRFEGAPTIRYRLEPGP